MSGYRTGHTPRADGQGALPGMAPEPAKRYETTMVAEMPKAWTCGCGKTSGGTACWNCGSPKPAAVADGTAEGGAV